MKFKLTDGQIVEGEPIIEGELIEGKLMEKKPKIKPTSSEKVAMGEYKFMMGIDWDTKEAFLITDEPKQKIFVNQKFADNSIFGGWCIFIKCQFGFDCEFGPGCEFRSGCQFGIDCQFRSGCQFGFDCEFGSGCQFRSGCIKNTPYWDEEGKH